MHHLIMSDSILGAMENCALLKPALEDYKDEIVSISHPIQISENTYLFRQSDDFTRIYLLVSGSIKLMRLAASGQEKVIEIVRPGQTFAEAVMFAGGTKYPVTAEALSDSVLVGIDADKYLELFYQSNQLCISMLGSLSRRLHWMINEVDRLTLHNATFRLVDYILTQVKENGHKSNGIKLSAPKNVIASRLSIKPETLSRTLRNLVSDNLITLSKGNIEILDIEKLQKLIELEE